MKQQVVRFAVSLAALGALAACGEEKEVLPQEGRYVIATSIFGDAGSATYVSNLISLDVQSIDLGKATEHPGFATIGTAGGKLFVGDGAAPVISRYGFGDDGRLEKEGSLSFGPRGLQTAPLYFNTFVDAEIAYVQHEQSKRVFWNPEALELVGAAGVETPGLEPTLNGLQLTSAFDRGIAVRDGLVFHPYYWTDANYYAFAPTSKIAVYAVDGSLVELLEAPCPGIDFVTSDEEGNLYFSNWVFSAAAPVLDASAPTTCAVRIQRGEHTIDEGWTRDLGELVDGRQTAAFRYLGGGVGVVAVFHEERIELSEDTQPSEITSASNWRLWTVHLGTGASAPVEGLEWMAGGYYAFRIDGRTFLLLPSADYSTTTVYELSDGRAAALFETPGWAYQLLKIE